METPPAFANPGENQVAILDCEESEDYLENRVVQASPTRKDDKLTRQRMKLYILFLF
jgi:hypothetical protein